MRSDPELLDDDPDMLSPDPDRFPPSPLEYPLGPQGPCTPDMAFKVVGSSRTLLLVFVAVLGLGFGSCTSMVTCVGCGSLEGGLGKL